MKKILVIDNYDSFTYNLVHYLQDLDCDVTVKRNDKLNLKEVENYDRVMKSHPNYLTIFYNRALLYKQRLKKIYLGKVKAQRC